MIPVLGAVLGGVMAVFGILKGGYKVGEAAESSADHVGRAPSIPSRIT